MYFCLRAAAHVIVVTVVIIVITAANRDVFLHIVAFSLVFNVAIVVVVAEVIIIARTKIFKHPKAAICINKPVDFM